MNASNWNELMVTLYAAANPGVGPFLAVAPLLGLASGMMLGSLRKMLP